MDIALVEHHMQRYFWDGPRFSRLSTISGPEPFLAKAGAELIDRSQRTAVQLLVAHIDLDWIDRERRGELVASLLIMQARDIGHAEYWKREWVFVRDFIKALLPPDNYKDLMATLPACHSDNQSSPFGTTFNDAKILFNHIIRVDLREMIQVRDLWKFVSRGAMIICPPGHHDIDIVLPVCFKGNTHSRNNMTAIVIQVKSDKRHPEDHSRNPFEHMNPFDVGLFFEGVAPLPVIGRMVFALGSDGFSVTFPAQENSDLVGLFTPCDFWLAGLLPGTFACIGDDDLSAYRAVLGPGSSSL